MNRLLRVFGSKRKRIKDLELKLRDESIQLEHLSVSADKMVNTLFEKDGEIDNLKKIIIGAAAKVEQLEKDLEKSNKKFNTQELIDKVKKEISG